MTDRLGLQIDPADLEKFKNIFKKIVGEIVEMPQTIVHRDYQSRNLMAYQGQFYLIDFQDALMGPVLYDMVALLRDSYIELNYDERLELLKFYQKQTLFDVYQNFDLLQRHFDLITLQRKLKDAGRFQYIKTVKGNPKFMVHFPSSIKYVKEALSRLKDFDDLGRLLQKYIPDYI
ncbi:MAG: Aminoglycoside phosphotransferase [uncultured bacterium]|nr:MAG: Aminoglycoside phosphotransferase [uncultured bacterium]